MPQSNSAVIKPKEVAERTSLSLSTIQRAIRAGTFPKPLKLGSIARFNSNTGPLTKTVSLGIDGSVRKGTAAFLTTGEVTTLELENLDAFSGVLEGLSHNQALSYGVSNRGDGPVLSERLWSKAVLLPG